MVLSTSLDFVDDNVSRGFWENLRVVLHVFLSVLISSGKHEFESNKEDGGSDGEFFFSVVSISYWVDLLLSFHETSANSSGVLVANFVNLDSVISAVERNDESSGLIIWFCAYKDSIKSKSVHVLLEHFFHVDLWWLGLKSEN